MLHVRLDQMSGGQGRHETELAGHDGGCDDTGEALGVGTRLSGVSTGDAEHVEHRPLGREDSSAAYGSDLDGRHGHGDEEVCAIIDPTCRADQPTLKEGEGGKRERVVIGEERRRWRRASEVLKTERMKIVYNRLKTKRLTIP